ncbi:hypothetical protein ACFQBY_07355 [Promicromonospora citrea]|uniref:WXG100 family type VII secretion target n=1 Tax=Promicromonospora citrea TaxID=43677 RepID=A0A8H9GK61_9MICO|nr:hypothetical protein [Promicromonospora citrea]NNH51335.1 hypothetical protein [Promicromonospora citrea]GGM33727.1 hypothetical protein GCM10010102_31620 [Promicromonospora citrea]
MAGYDLSIDMEQLRKLSDDLKAISNELEHADGNAKDAAEATGHDELRDRVNDFADKWEIKRGEMLENVKKLSGIITSISEAFSEVDTGLAKALEDAAAK